MRIPIINETREAFPEVAFDAIKNSALGKSYELTLVIASSTLAKRLNLTYRNKNHATDILSFPLSKNEGEIYICQSVARKKAREFGVTYEKYFALLFIHGCAHLKGYDHGDTMEAFEAKLQKELDEQTKSKNGAKHRNRNRRGHLSDEGRHRQRQGKK